MIKFIYLNTLYYSGIRYTMSFERVNRGRKEELKRTIAGILFLVQIVLIILYVVLYFVYGYNPSNPYMLFLKQVLFYIA